MTKLDAVNPALKRGICIVTSLDNLQRFLLTSVFLEFLDIFWCLFNTLHTSKPPSVKGIGVGGALRIRFLVQSSTTISAKV